MTIVQRISEAGSTAELERLYSEAQLHEETLSNWTIRKDELAAGDAQDAHASSGEDRGAGLAVQSESAGDEDTQTGEGNPPPKQRRKSQSERLHESVANADVDLFHDAEQRTYATFEQGGHRETWPVRSAGFRRYVSFLYYQLNGSAPRASDLADFQNTLEGKAQFEGEQHRVHVRIADRDDGLVIDLGDPGWAAIEVDADGWRHVKDPPVKFIRPRGVLPLSMPVEGGSLDQLRPFINVGDGDDWTLILGFLVGMIRPRGPYPVLALHGEQGAAKSTAMRVLRRLVDPRETLDRSAPRNDHDLAIHAMHNRVIALDNVSTIPDWLSDALARLSTGSGFSTRQLYTDAEEFSFNAARPLLVNGIGEVIERSDLLDRAILVRLAPIPDADRRLESEFWSAFDAAQPAILGALLDVVVCAIDRERTVKLKSLPRMADFARWVTAAEPALGWDHGTFLKAYHGNRAQAHEMALDADPIAVALRDLMTQDGTWEGKPTELLDMLGELAGETVTRRKNWPQAANAMSTRLERLKPNLRAIGIEVERDRGRSQRTIIVRRLQETVTTVTTDTTKRAAGDDGDADDGRTLRPDNGVDLGRQDPGHHGSQGTGPHGPRSGPLSYQDGFDPERATDDDREIFAMTRPGTQLSIDGGLEVRTCPACHHEHPAGTTCLACGACRAQDLVAIAQEMFTDLVPGGSAVAEARTRHHQVLRAGGVCDTRCGLPRCRGTHIDPWPPEGDAEDQPEDPPMKKESNTMIVDYDPTSASPPTIDEIKAERVAGASREIALLTAWAKGHPLLDRAREAVEQRDWESALHYLDSHQRLGLYADWWQFGCLTIEEFRRDFPSVWTDAEPDDTKPLWLELWTQAAQTGRVEQEPLPDGDPVTIYRGEPEAPKRKTRGISWSLDRDVAVFFALRNARGTGVVIEGTVPRHAVLGYLTEREESEVIVPTKHITVIGITSVSEADRPAREEMRRAPTPC